MAKRLYSTKEMSPFHAIRRGQRKKRDLSKEKPEIVRTEWVFELEDLLGDHKLSGIGPENEQYDGTRALSFILDGEVITAIEDENDDYRSSLGRLIVGGLGAKIKEFKAIDVTGVSRGGSIVDIVDQNTLRTILSIGTDDSDDYYPSFVAYSYGI